ncbi:Glycosyltransferase, catalytic subunit of cellulose synthase and poly-beta-1,6-N-acetylglucosamine synthase [Pedobacter steynii]|uniref:Glycosyltransferase, catalytic subunit of cellulose synthase and poly-beta-1,6-N-acetylglucosamine synthase n=1 Tax=Pedobacter steynii TaxID=430522 RepID=A0A1G9Z542_9SPHI|nr:glycosyltransferase [Pedobacter steynii]NQX39948.1 glycosyltransferase [Pedobacter steynii]SDN16337.1 Glycosyltransferase, catalytic subunit of cellulose synthase and poly-beta-1,6-N-acetylglucosamine synthase [Pedobacter steynii]
MKRNNPVINPTKYQLFTLRLMIFLGVFCMFFFFAELFRMDTDSAPLYWMLLSTIGFACAQIIHEWIHYLFITVPKKPGPQKDFTVDVFTTFCAGEPYEMIKETLIAIKAITYPHQTYLCDEANDPYLKDFCEEHGIHHVTRSLKIDAKAGNINNALKHSSSELCLVLDPDHVPFPDFLDHVIPHFNRPEIGFVQVVQSYKNQDQTLIAKGAAQQTYQFYGPMMMTMNKYGTVLAIGANCTFRREALDSIGGHAAGLAEDMHTSMQLHAKGWKSVYVPVVVARGLVPNTLSAYYSQQLKWARGVFELWVTSYPELFRKFSWKQKIHYGTIPVFYLSGIFYLLNFIIPIASLMGNTSPVNIDFSKFFILAFPLTILIILIRHFVQKWVMEEEERGFHLVGGLLMIGTWWIFLIGFVYTLLRIKVPYIPTPKDDEEGDNRLLNLPNMLVIFISLVAIGYGLYHDLNPYNLFMAGFAAFNCLILLFTIAASKQLQFRKYKVKHAYLFFVMQQIAIFKTHFWKFRRRVYGWMRNAALLITGAITCFTVYLITAQKSGTEAATRPFPDRRDLLIPGVFAPSQSEGLSSMRLVREIEKQSDIHFGIVSLYLSWGDQKKNELPGKLLDSIYDANAVPMITWEPWQSLFEQTRNDKEKEVKVFSRITDGKYDAYLSRFSNQVKALNRPVFIRFAHEADNPQYPWSAVGGNTPAEFIAAWKYVHDYFGNHQVHNVIWVWNPWKAEAVKTYFPGKEYVDWIGVTNLNYANQNPDGKSYTMEELYEPFHRLKEFKNGLPVMLAETGSLRTAAGQQEWLQNAFHQVDTRYPEIKSIVFFDSGEDKNTLITNSNSHLDWRVEDFNPIGKVLKASRKHTRWVSNQTIVRPESGQMTDKKRTFSSGKTEDIRGVNYTRDQNWKISYHSLKKEEIINDFRQMKQMGINTIKHFGPNIYDHNILNVAAQKNLGVVYSFWIEDQNNFITAVEKMERFADEILKTVNRLKHNKNIIIWNIGNTPMLQMEAHFYKPDLFYPREVYLSWLRKLVLSIQQADPGRPVAVDLALNSKLGANAVLLQDRVPFAYLGLVAGNHENDEHDEDEIKKLKMPYFYSSINPDHYLKLKSKISGAIIENWQDQQTKNTVSFDGLKDLYGNNKTELYGLGARWNGLNRPEPIPGMKILKPATTILESGTATYHVMYEVNEGWKILTNPKDLKFKWHLVKNDSYGNPIQTNEIGTGAEITLKIPASPKRYQLYLYVIKGRQVQVIKSNLNTPLIP